MRRTPDFCAIGVGTLWFPGIMQVKMILHYTPIGYIIKTNWISGEKNTYHDINTCRYIMKLRRKNHGGQPDRGKNVAG